MRVSSLSLCCLVVLAACVLGARAGPGLKVAPQGSAALQQRLEQLRAAHPEAMRTAVVKTYGKDTYVGTLVDKVMDGYGEYTWTEEGRVYLGEWKNGLPNGQGVETIEGTKYTGQWRNGHKQGEGVFESGSGEKYEGHFDLSKYSGKGSFTYADGAVYRGDFKDGQQNGRGNWTSSHGEWFEGDWVNNVLTGKGTAAGPGWTYSGSFSENYLHGVGHLINGTEEYEGSLRNGLYHGLGTLTKKGEQPVKAWWRLNQFYVSYDEEKYPSELMTHLLLDEYPGPAVPPEEQPPFVLPPSPLTRAEIADRLHELGVVPDVVNEEAAKAVNFLEVYYTVTSDGVAEEEEEGELVEALLDFGATVPPTVVQSSPSVTVMFDSGEQDEDLDSYTLLLVDPDAPSRKDPSQKLWLHWLLADLHVDDVGNLMLDDGIELAPYIGAGPPKDTGLHRYVFLLYRQTSETDWQGFEPLLETVAGRGGFSLDDFVNTHKLGVLVSSSAFQAEWDESVPTLYERLQANAKEAEEMAAAMQQEQQQQVEEQQAEEKQGSAKVHEELCTPEEEGWMGGL